MVYGLKRGPDPIEPRKAEGCPLSYPLAVTGKIETAPDRLAFWECVLVRLEAHPILPYWVRPPKIALVTRLATLSPGIAPGLFGVYVNVEYHALGMRQLICN